MELTVIPLKNIKICLKIYNLNFIAFKFHAFSPKQSVGKVIAILVAIVLISVYCPLHFHFKFFFQLVLSTVLLVNLYCLLSFGDCFIIVL